MSLFVICHSVTVQLIHLSLSSHKIYRFMHLESSWYKEGKTTRIFTRLIFFQTKHLAVEKTLVLNKMPKTHDLPLTPLTPGV